MGTDREARLEAALREVLASASPHPREHPTMTAAWAMAQAVLAEATPPEATPEPPTPENPPCICTHAENQRVSGVCPTCGGALGVRGCEECIHDSDLRIRAESRLDALLSRLEALEQRYRADCEDAKERRRLAMDRADYDAELRSGTRAYTLQQVAHDLAALRQEMGQ